MYLKLKVQGKVLLGLGILNLTYIVDLSSETLAHDKHDKYLLWSFISKFDDRGLDDGKDAEDDTEE